MDILISSTWVVEIGLNYFFPPPHKKRKRRKKSYPLSHFFYPSWLCYCYTFSLKKLKRNLCKLCIIALKPHDKSCLFCFENKYNFIIYSKISPLKQIDRDNLDLIVVLLFISHQKGKLPELFFLNIHFY